MNKTKGCLIANFATVPGRMPGLLPQAHQISNNTNDPNDCSDTYD
nr:hypothetical protein [Klebsiella pneumoniae]